MSVEPDPIFSNYTVTGTGPYAILWPYSTGAVRAAAVLAGVRTDLVGGTDFTVAPLTSDTTGNLTLSGPAAAAYAGATLYLSRDTVAEQGWIGVLGDREKGLETQLDLMTMKVQELEHVREGALRLDTPTLPFVPVPGAVVMFDPFGQPMSGPTATEVANANADAVAAHLDRVAADADAVAAAASAVAAAASAAAADVRRNANQTFTGLNTFANDVTINADKTLYMGTAQEAQLLYSTAGDKWIARAKTAATWLSMRFSNLEFNTFDNAKSIIRGLVNGAVELYYNGLKRLETEAAGVVVTGRIRETDRASEAWHTVSRTAGTFYQNTTGRSISVSVRGLNGAGSGSLILTVNSTATPNNVAVDSRQVATYVTIGATVPPGHYYQVSVTGTMALDLVQELS